MFDVDFAHGTDVPGHPFKGGDIRPAGYLLHPDMIRFQIQTPYFFAKSDPSKIPGAQVAAPQVPSFGSFFSSYFAGQTLFGLKLSNDSCQKMFSNLKKCYENSTSRGTSPETSCAYYIDGFKRLSCSQ